MAGNEQFFQRDKQAAAVLKHEILSAYGHVFSTMLSSRGNGSRVWFLDGYAGPGRYRPLPGEEIGQAGSPLLALHTAQRLAEYSTPRELRCVFIESNPEYARNLSSVLEKEAPANTNYEVIQGKVEDHLQVAVAKMSDDPLLAFLDPFGTSLPCDLMISTLMKRGRSAPTEVLLNFNLDAIRRIGALLGRSSETTSTDEKTLRRVDDFLGGTEWRAEFVKHYSPGVRGSATAAAEVVGDVFRKFVLENAGFSSVSFPIRRQVGHEPIFLMTLFFQHAAAPFVFAEAVSLANQAWRRHLLEAEARKDAATHADTLFGVDFSQEYFEKKWREDELVRKNDWVRRIVANLTKLLQPGRSVSIQDSVQEIFGDTLGLAREMHLRAAWKILAAEGLVSSPPSRLRNAMITALH